jgi:hypothetical protein
MSKGPGIWQRHILAVLDKHPAVHLADLLERPYTRARYVALHRAAYVLADQGKIEIWNGQLRGMIWISRPGYESNARPPRINLSVDTMPTNDRINI